MKKIKIAVVISTLSLIGLGVKAHAQDGTGADSQQTVIGDNSAKIDVNGTLGVDNTDPDATIPEGEDNWINVTIPTKTIFYNKLATPAIVSPKYVIKNNSGRPVKVTTDSFVAKAGNPSTPADYNLNLNVIGTSISVPLINTGSINNIGGTVVGTLANSKGQLVSTDPLVATPTNNSAQFEFGGSATTTDTVRVNYDLTMKFEAISWN